MPRVVLSESRIKSSVPRASAYDIRDAMLPGFGLRVLPSGAIRFFVHIQCRGKRVWKTVGDANVMTLDEARTRAASMLSEIGSVPDPTHAAQGTRFEDVAEAVFQRYAQVWKPGTLRREAVPCHALPPPDRHGDWVARRAQSART